MDETTRLTWAKPELLTDGTAWMCKDNAIAILRGRGLAVTNETLATMCDEAIAFLSTLTATASRKLVAGYRMVREALS